LQYTYVAGPPPPQSDELQIFADEMQKAALNRVPGGHALG
jgi:hypothetical protein